MKFTKLHIENFLAITDAEINLADRGLVGIQGVNHADTSADSNGSGKSSIADALCWCWFGVTARGSSGDEVINHDAKKGTRVVSVLEDGHLTYTATRHRKHKTGKNTLTLTVHDGLKETDLTKGTDKLTQEVAQQIIGCSLDVFVGSIYAGQERMPDLPAMTDKNLKVLIEEAAGVTVLEGAYKKAREQLAEAQAEVMRIETGVDGVRSKIAFLDTQILSTREAQKEWEDTRAKEIDAYKTQLAALIPKIKSQQTEVARLEAEDPAGKLAAVEKQIAAVDGEHKQLEALQRAVFDAEGKLIAAQRERAGLEAELEELQQHAGHVDDQVGSKCKSCGHAITEGDLKTVKEKIEGDIALNKALTADVMIKVSAADTAMREAVRERDTFRASMTDLSAANAERSKYGLAVHALQGAKLDLQATVDRARSMKEHMNDLVARPNPFVAQLKKQEDEKAKLEKELVEIQLRLDEAREKAILEEAVVKVFSPAGVRARILDDVTPFLNAQTSKYLATLSDGNMSAVWTTLTKTAKGELKEKFSIDVTNDTGGQVFKSLSGGEKRKVRLATALALQDLVATRATKPIDLFIGDEIDDALDPAGLERLTIILEEKARERGSVFVISHNELRDHIKNVLLVEKMPDKTTKVSEVVL